MILNMLTLSLSEPGVIFFKPVIPLQRWRIFKYVRFPANGKWTQKAE